MLIPMPPREEWLALRRKYLGASEVAGLYGVQADYAMSHYALFHVKAGVAPEPDVQGARPKWGLRLQDVIAAAVDEEHGYVSTPGGYATADDCPGMGASLDFTVASDVVGQWPGPGVLETKNTDFIVHKRAWTDDEPPLPILLQLQHQLGCTGYAWGMVAVLVGGNDLRIYRYPARPNLIADIKARVAAFWRSIAENKPPPVDGSDSAAAVLKALHPEPADDAIDLSASNEFPEAAAAFMVAQSDKKEATDAYDLARNRLAALLGDHRRGYGGGWSATVSLTAAKPDRPAKPGEIIKGRAESRRIIVKESVGEEPL